MLEVRWLWRLGFITIAAGIAVLLLSWMTIGIGCGDPEPGCHTIYSTPLGFLGMLLLVVGTGLVTYACHRIAQEKAEARPLLLASGAAFVVCLMVLLVVFNPLISPYSFIRDSDLDGYTDDVDDYDDDSSRHYTTYLEALVSSEHASNNLTVVIVDLYVHVMDAPPTTDGLVLLVGEYTDFYYEGPMEEIGNLAQINDTWVQGVKYVDQGPYGMLSVNDTITIDTTIYELSIRIRITDDHGYVVCRLLG